MKEQRTLQRGKEQSSHVAVPAQPGVIDEALIGSLQMPAPMVTRSTAS